MRDTVTTCDIRLEQPPVAVIGSDSPRCRALIEALRELALPGIGCFTLTDGGLRRLDRPDPAIEQTLREPFGGEPVLHCYLVDGDWPPVRPERAWLTLAVWLDGTPAPAELRAHCDLVIRYDGADAEPLRVLLHGLYQLLFEQGLICVDVADVLAVMERAECGMFAVGRGVDVATAARAARRDLVRQGAPLRRAVGLLTLVRSDDSLELREVTDLIDALSGELAGSVPHACSWRRIDGAGIEVVLLNCLAASPGDIGPYCGTF